MRIYSRSKGSHYIDTSFPPNSTSLIRYPEKLSANELILWKVYKWIHCSELPDNRKAQVANDISALYVTQGQLGNCYFVSVLISLGLIPERIRNLISHEVKGSERERFSVNVYPMGICTKIEVDGYFPYVDRCQSLAFSKSDKSELWPMILEKSWAKYLGSYHAAAGLSPAVAFTFLSGFPSVNVRLSETKANELWNILTKAQDNKFSMVCSSLDCKEAQQDEGYRSLGLVSNHAYTLLGVKEKKGAKRMQKLVKVRNPWGRLEWAGAVGTTSNVMSGSVITKGEGVFYMNFEDFYKYFETVTICKYQPTFIHETVKLELEGVEHVVKVKVTKETVGYFQLILDFKKELVPLSMVMGYRNPNNRSVEYVASDQIISNRLFIEQKLKKGKYICFISIKDKKSHTNATFIASTEGQHTIKHVNKETKRMAYLRSMLRTYVVKKGKKERLGQGVYKYYTQTAIPGGYFADLYTNFSKESTLYTEVQYANANAVRVIPSNEGGYKVTVSPSEEACLCMKINEQETNYRYTYKALLDKPKLELIEEVHKGKLKLSSNVTVTKGFGYKSYQHDLGFIFEFVNYTSDTTFAGKFEFTLINLKFLDPCDNNCLIIQLQPKEVKYAVLKAKDPFSLKSTYSISYMHESKLLNRSKEDLIRELKERGKETRLERGGACIYAKYIDSDYYIMVTNSTGRTLSFEITFNGVKNLSCSEGESWKDTLNPAEREKIKVLKRRESFKETKCVFRISYQFY
jgi:hypothetical protein